MPDDRLRQSFAKDRAARHGSLLPYFTAGFPDNDTLAELIRRADRAGVAAVEIGFPYSDSIADGPVIQSSFHDSLSRGQKLRDTFELISQIRSEVGCALLAMVSCSIVVRVGVEAFMARAADSGFDGVIIPDVPAEEAPPVREAALLAGLCYIGLVAPNTPRARRATIAGGSTGFVYQIAVAGTTGERSELPASLADDVAELRRVSDVPVCVGFGISTPEQVREVCRVSDGAIVGSALIRRIREAQAAGAQRDALVESVATFLSTLMSGTVLQGG